MAANAHSIIPIPMRRGRGRRRRRGRRRLGAEERKEATAGAMILRIRSRDGTDRITVPDAAAATVGDLQRLIAERVTVPVHLQRLSLDPALLLPQAATAAAPPPLLSDPLLMGPVACGCDAVDKTPLLCSI